MLYSRRLKMLLCNTIFKFSRINTKIFAVILLILVGILYRLQDTILVGLDKVHTPSSATTTEPNHRTNIREPQQQQDKKAPPPIVNYEPFCGPHQLHGAFQANNALSSAVNSSGCSVSPINDAVCKKIHLQYYQTLPVEECQPTIEVEFCQSMDHPFMQGNNFPFSCDFSSCSMDHSGSFAIINGSSGMLVKYEFKTHDFDLKSIKTAADKAVRDRNPYMFLECTDGISRSKIRQLLILPYVSPQKPEVGRDSRVSMNLIMVDSVSRPHFYRSLPNTVRYLDHLASTNDFAVFDFELFHSLKGRTYEALRALFSGDSTLLGEEFEGVTEPPSRVKFELLLKRFKELGYETLYQEDLCWEYDWGLIKDTGVHMEHLPKEKRFLAFLKAIKASSIDSVGLSHSSCEIFRQYGIIDQFGFPHSVCYGKQYQHDFFLKYIEKAIGQRNRGPLFSFLMTDVGHEGTGKRIRTLDKSFVKFLSAVKSDDDTIHVIFSDHGNSYGPFSRTLEGLLETYHPSMFMIVPKKVTKIIGNLKMNNLMVNQKRLVTVLDLHYTLLQLLRLPDASQMPDKGTMAVSNLGLFQPIPATRSCDELKLHRSTLCYCEGWKLSLPVRSVHYLMAEYALAAINKKIVRSQRSRNGIHHKNGRVCQQLLGVNVSNVWQRKKEKFIFIGLDVHVQEGDFFSVIISLRIGEEDTFDFKIKSIERRSSYGRYRACATRNIPLRFCICTEKPSISVLPGSTFASMFGVQTIHTAIDRDCLYLFRRDYKAGVVFEAFNACRNVSYTVLLTLQLTNMKLASRYNSYIVLPKAVRHLAVAIMHEPGFEWKYVYTVKFSNKSVHSIAT